MRGTQAVTGHARSSACDRRDCIAKGNGQQSPFQFAPESPENKPAPPDLIWNLYCCAQESQRLLSVLPILFRQAQADVRIGELLVPRGTFCIVHLVRLAAWCALSLKPVVLQKC